MDVKDLVAQMDERGLSATKWTRVERNDGKEQAPYYLPAADIANLFPCLLSAAINDLEGSAPDATVDNFSEVLLKQLLPALYEEMPGKDGNCEEIALTVDKALKKIGRHYPQEIGDVAYNFLYFALVAYAIAIKHGFRSVPTVMGGNGVFRYFAMLGVWSKLSPETQRAVVTELADQDLWGADPDAL